MIGRKVIVCEGKTETGFLISLDKDYWQEKHRNDATWRKYQTMAEAGVSPIESPKSGGSESPKYAVALAKLGYRVAYFGDSDCDLNPSEEQMKTAGVEKVLLWDGDVENAPILSGAVAGRIHDIPSVQELINRIIGEAEIRISKLQKFLI